MRRLLAFVLVVVLAYSFAPCAFADSDNVLFVPTKSDLYNNALEYSSLDWILSGEARALLSIMLLVDIDDSKLYNGNIISDTSIANAYVAYDATNDMVVVMYPYKTNSVFMVMYTAGAGLASYVAVESVGNVETFIKGFMDYQGYILYYKNTVDDCLTIMDILVS